MSTQDATPPTVIKLHERTPERPTATPPVVKDFFPDSPGSSLEWEDWNGNDRALNLRQRKDGVGDARSDAPARRRANIQKVKPTEKLEASILTFPKVTDAAINIRDTSLRHAPQSPAGARSKPTSTQAKHSDGFAASPTQSGTRARVSLSTSSVTPETRFPPIKPLMPEPTSNAEVPASEATTPPSRQAKPTASWFRPLVVLAVLSGTLILLKWVN